MTPTLKQLEYDLLQLVGSLNLKPVLNDAIRVGELLDQAKQVVPYREWSSWLSRLRLTQRSAHDYLACYRHRSQRAPAEMSIRRFLEHVRKVAREEREDELERERKRHRDAASDQDGPTPPGIELHHADARKFSWPSGVDLVATDPPWADLEAYRWLATMAATQLRPGGLILCQSGTKFLAEVLTIFAGAGLVYQWTLSIVYRQSAQAGPVGNWRPGWRPVVVFSRGRPGKLNTVSDTYTVGAGSPQNLHPWQQAAKPWELWLDRLTPPNGLVVDPFCGSGTTGLAARKIGRRWIGCEIDQDHYRVARGRLTGST